MKKIIIAIASTMLYAVILNAFFLGNKSLTLLKCNYGQWGYEYGYIGIYEDSDNNIYKIFFGNNWCQN
ncbi:hypothetical protein [Helicobacter sp. MIT 14-3879]|uniref:hypothetical protein n=1 Tax=Helicobacter sp. MIT 14-3879 TaxID=2040649 RepID=UPI000E1F974C|nr:hypothetical protein [Helicobacter sp. MIT 14-3879]RDU65150.1 hypothetical protein CQA44_02220 [Helicobacter sp. MIT 14-3879]